MTSNSKSTPSENKHKPSARRKFGKRDWIIIPITLMVIACLTLTILKSYTLTNILTAPFYDAFWFPPFPSLLVAIFGIVYIYKTLQRKFISDLAKAIVYVLLVVFVIFMFFVGMIITGKGQTCAGIDGVLSACLEVHALMLQTLFANTLSLVLLSVLAITGGAALLMKPKTSA